METLIRKGPDSKNLDTEVEGGTKSLDCLCRSIFLYVSFCLCSTVSVSKSYIEVIYIVVRVLIEGPSLEGDETRVLTVCKRTCFNISVEK